MKKQILILMLFVSVLVSAQITIHNDNTGSNINDGDTVTVNQDHTATFVTITNNYSFDINLQMEVTSITNTDGREMSLCFGVSGAGQCLNQIQVGDIYNGGAPLSAGASTGSNDVDFNHIEGNHGAVFNTYPKDYVFKIRALNTTDNSVLTEITFTYRYDPNAQSIDNLDFNNRFKVKNLQDKLLINTPVAAQLLMYNMTGQEVKRINLYEGKNNIDTNDLSQGIYIIRAISKELDVYKKIIIK